MIFISYSRKDLKYVTLLVNICKTQEIKVFIDIQNINFGDKWLPALEKAINESEKFYLFWSKNAVQSKYVQTEIDLVKRKEIPVIIPIIMDKTPLPDKVSEYNGFEYVKNEYDELRKREKISRFYKMSTIVLSFALIFVTLSFTLNSNVNLMNPALDDEVYIEEDIFGSSVKYDEDFHSIGIDSASSSAVETPASSPTIVDDEIVSETENYFMLIPEYLGVFILLIIIYLFINYRVQRRMFNNKVKEFAKHI